MVLSAVDPARELVRDENDLSRYCHVKVGPVGATTPLPFSCGRGSATRCTIPGQEWRGQPNCPVCGRELCPTCRLKCDRLM